MICKMCKRLMNEEKTIIKGRIKYTCYCGKVLIIDNGRIEKSQYNY